MCNARREARHRRRHHQRRGLQPVESARPAGPRGSSAEAQRPDAGSIRLVPRNRISLPARHSGGTRGPAGGAAARRAEAKPGCDLAGAWTPRLARAAADPLRRWRQREVPARARVAGELAQRGVPTLYADWESTAGDHRDRLEHLFGPAMPAVHYVRCERPLVHEADRLRRLILAHTSSTSSWIRSPSAGRPARGRRIRQRLLSRPPTTPCWLPAHRPHHEGGKRGPATVWLAFWHNGARATWFIKRSEADGDPG